MHQTYAHYPILTTRRDKAKYQHEKEEDPAHGQKQRTAEIQQH